MVNSDQCNEDTR